MENDRNLCSKKLAIDSGLGAGAGAVLVALILGLDVLGFGTMALQVEHTALHIAAMMVKPMMLLGVVALAASLFRQLAPARERLESRAGLARGQIFATRLAGARS